MNKYKIGKVPKCGSVDSKFFSNHNGFENSINKRNKYFEKSLEGLENLIDKLGTEYVKQGLGIKENFEKDIITKMMLKRM